MDVALRAGLVFCVVLVVWCPFSNTKGSHFDAKGIEHLLTNAEKTAIASVDGDPDFIVGVQGLAHPLCFRVEGHPGHVIRLLQDPESGVVVNARISRPVPGSSKTYLSAVLISRRNFRLVAKVGRVLVNRYRFAWGPVSVRLVHGHRVLIAPTLLALTLRNKNVTLVVKRHLPEGRLFANGTIIPRSNHTASAPNTNPHYDGTSGSGSPSGRRGRGGRQRIDVDRGPRQRSRRRRRRRRQRNRLRRGRRGKRQDEEREEMADRKKKKRRKRRKGESAEKSDRWGDGKIPVTKTRQKRFAGWMDSNEASAAVHGDLDFRTTTAMNTTPQEEGADSGEEDSQNPHNRHPRSASSSPPQRRRGDIAPRNRGDMDGPLGGRRMADGGGADASSSDDGNATASGQLTARDLAAYMGFYVADARDLSANTHGLLGQFLHKSVTLQRVRVKPNGVTKARLLVESPRPHHVKATRRTRTNLALNASSTCWWLKDGGRGVVERATSFPGSGKPTYFRFRQAA